MQSGAFKSYARAGRSYIAEESFTGGIKQSAAPLDEGFAHMLVNYDFKDSGRTLQPRGGYRTVPHTDRIIGHATYPHRPLFTERLLNTDNDDIQRVALIVPDIDTATSCPLSDIKVLVERDAVAETPITEFVPFADADNKSIIYSAQDMFVRIHDMPLLHNSARQSHTVLNGTCYIPMLSGESRQFGAMTLDDTSMHLEPITPKSITPAEATNYGYNMLSATPYTFEDRINPSVAAGDIRCTGILPYKDSTCAEVLFNAKVGSFVTFRLVSEWANTTDKFKFKWELRDLESDAVTTYFAPTAETPSYTFNGTNAVSSNGSAHVVLTIQPPYRQFAVTVTAYNADDLTEPIQVTVLASYTLTDDASSSKISNELKNYDLTTATGMCTWAQRVVLWGVQGAKNILFVSDVNDISYFPYPNNCDITNGEIIACVPFQDDLLVFTDTELIKMVWAADGLSYTSSIIQSNLVMSPFDTSTVVPVKNMVFFKNGTYYYMIVPTVTSTLKEGSPALAPISLPITDMLDNFEDTLRELFESMYNYTDVSFELLDYYNYLEGNSVRNVYKLRLLKNDTELTVVDFILSYDTLQRVWYTYIVETNNTILLPYQHNATNNMLMLNVYHEYVARYTEDEEGTTTQVNGYTAHAEFVRISKTNAQDDMTLERGTDESGRFVKNWQYIDTGYKNQNSVVKKRYREIQFQIKNSDHVSLEFGAEFLVDNSTRRGIYKSEVEVSEYDEANPNFGVLTVNRELDSLLYAPGETVLEFPDDEPVAATPLSEGALLQSNSFALDASQLPTATLYKVRFPVSGKGYTPRLKLLSLNEKRYELLNICWVFRSMNAR